MPVKGEVSPIPVGLVAPLKHPEAMALATQEFDQMIDLLAALEASEWTLATVCGLWDVRAMSAHVLGMAEAQASVRQFAHDYRAAQKRSSGAMIDAMTERQVADRAHLTPADIVGRLRIVAPKSIKARRRTPAPVRRVVRMRQDEPFADERWPFGFLVDKIFTRDTWMHRLDISRATGRPMALSPNHDGRLVSDVVAEWALRHKRPFDLVLTGPAGGHWRAGEGGEHIELEATEFCWTLAGRAPATGLLATPVPF